MIGDDEYRGLQIALMLRPEQGPVIPGSSGFSKSEQGDLTRAQARQLGQLVREEFK